MGSAVMRPTPGEWRCCHPRAAERAAPPPEGHSLSDSLGADTAKIASLRHCGEAGDAHAMAMEPLLGDAGVVASACRAAPKVAESVSIRNVTVNASCCHPWGRYGQGRFAQTSRRGRSCPCDGHATAARGCRRSCLGMPCGGNGGAHAMAMQPPLEEAGVNLGRPCIATSAYRYIGIHW